MFQSQTFKEVHMQCKFTFKHLEPLESITQYAETKIEKIEKYNLHKEMIVQFIFSVQKDDQIAEIIVNAGKEHFTAIAKNPTLYVAIDLAVEKIDHQLGKHKDKVQHHHDFASSKEGRLNQEIAAQALEVKLEKKQN
jgi:putative sigma-54 modulation protein